MKLNPGVVLTVALGLGIWIRPGAVSPATVLPKDDASQVVTIRNLKIEGGGVSGEVVNLSRHTVRGAQLLIRHTWLWNNEYRPKDDSRGEAVYLTIEGDIPPGGSMPFTHKPSQPMAAQPDGYFETAVSVAGFAQVIK